MSVIYHFIIIVLLHVSFFPPTLLAGFHCNINENKSPPLSRTLRSILSDFRSIVIWILLILTLIASSWSLFSRFLLIVSKAYFTINIMVYLILQSLHRLLLLLLLHHIINITPYSPAFSDYYYYHSSYYYYLIFLSLLILLLFFFVNTSYYYC